MKKYSFALITLITYFIATGQTYIFPETFPPSPGVISVTARSDYLCYKPVKKDKLTAKYFFDNNGNNTACVFICDNKPCGKQLYHYENGKMVSYKNYGSWTNDENDLNGSKWDSTVLTTEVIYKYQNGRITGVQYSDQFREGAGTEISYIYDANGVLVKEQVVSYYDSLGADLTTIHVPVRGVKEYAYKDTLTTIEYYRNDKLSATETITKNKAGMLLKTELKSVKGKMLKRVLYKYNAKMQLSEMSAADTGYDGFGNPYDMTAWDKTIFLYDDTGRLIGKQHFTKGTICAADRYEYNR